MNLSRRSLIAAGALSALPSAGAQTTPGQPRPSYENDAKGIRILAGQWRPHYRWEQIAWISPSWPSQDYVWLDFPEAIFTNVGLLYLSHVNPPFPALFPNLPATPWQTVENGIAFERHLPNGIRFGGSVVRSSQNLAELELHIYNGSQRPLTDIVLQTCAYLRGIKEFAEFTSANKYVHVGSSGWVKLSEALAGRVEGSGGYRVGWRRSGKPIADLPVTVALSNQGERLVAMTWRTDTLSLVGNPNHPCMHADPKFADIEPGQSSSIHGAIAFFEGRLEDFDAGKILLR